MHTYISRAIRQSLPNVNPSHLQPILLNQAGDLIYSSDTLVSLNPWLQKNIVSTYPFIESIFPFLIKEEKITNFPTVGLTVEGVFLGYFEYFFQKINIEGNDYLLWIMKKNQEAIAQKQNQQLLQEKILEEEALNKF